MLLLQTGYNQQDLYGPQHFGSLPIASNQIPNPSNCDCIRKYDDQDALLISPLVTRDESEKVLTEATCLLEEDPLSSKGAIPKRVLAEDEYTIISRCDATNPPENLSQRDLTKAGASSSLYSYQSSEDLRSRRDLIKCSGPQILNSVFLNNKSADSLTYSNACCLEHYGPYYVYKHVKCYPHKSYSPYEEMTIRHQQPVAPYNYTHNKPTISELNKPSSNKVNMNEISRVPENKFNESFNKEDKEIGVHHKSFQHPDPMESKRWGHSLGNVICGSKKSKNQKEKAKQETSAAADSRFPINKKLDPVLINENSLSRASAKKNESSPSKLPILPRDNDPRKLKALKKLPSKVSAGEESMTNEKRKPPAHVLSTLDMGAASKYPIYQPSLQVIKDQRELDRLKSERVLARSSHRLKEMDNTQVYRKKEQLGFFGEGLSTNFASDETNERIKKQENFRENDQELTSFKKTKDTKDNKNHELPKKIELKDNKDNKTTTQEEILERKPSLKDNGSDIVVYRPITDSLKISSSSSTSLRPSNLQEDLKISGRDVGRINETTEDPSKRSPKPMKSVTVSEAEVEIISEPKISPRSSKRTQDQPLKSILRTKTCK